MPTPLCGHESKTDGCASCHWWYDEGERGLAFRARFAPPPAAEQTVGDEPLEVPLWQRAANFARALTRHVVAGLPQATETDREVRLSVCRDCDQHRGDGTCGKCGCVTTVKAAWAQETCPLGKWPPSSVVDPVAATPITPVSLGSVHAFNASLFRHRGRLLLAFRDGWAGSNVRIAEMSEDLHPGRVVVLDRLENPRARYGREDPRLFVHDDRLHVMYVGVEPNPHGGGFGQTSIQYARLTDDLTTEAVWYPEPSGFTRQVMEKNWVPFSWEGQLLAVYSVRPHIVVHLVGDRAFPFAQSNPPLPWTGGHLRGGAAPVRVGDEWWHWFHGKVYPGETGPDGKVATRYVYSMGVYTFAAKPPFAPVRITPRPLVVADPATCPPDQYCPVVFPCGAVLDGDRWRVSVGVHDRTTTVYEYDHRQVEKAMVRV